MGDVPAITGATGPAPGHAEQIWAADVLIVLQPTPAHSGSGAAERCSSSRFVTESTLSGQFTMAVTQQSRPVNGQPKWLWAGHKEPTLACIGRGFSLEFARPRYGAVRSAPCVVAGSTRMAVGCRGYGGSATRTALDALAVTTASRRPSPTGA